MKVRENILIVEDEEAWRELLGKWLRDEGYLVEYAGDFATASDRILKKSWFAGFDLSLCVVDLRLNSSKPDNFEGVGLLAICKIINVPTVAITAYLPEGMREQLRQFGAFDAIDKSAFSGPEFVEIIERALGTVPQEFSLPPSTADQRAFETLLKSMIEVVESNYKRATDRINSLYSNNLKALGSRARDEDVAQWKAELQKLEESRKDLIGRLAGTSSNDQVRALVPDIQKVAASW